MATETKPEKPMEEAKKKSKINAPPKLLPGSFKDGNFSDTTSCVSSVDAANTLKENDIDQEPLSYYPVNYYGYYYPVSFAERDEQSYLVGSNEVPETHQTAFPAANPSVLYYTPEFQTAYNSYSPYISGTYLTTDGQYLSQHLGQHGYYAGPNFPLVPGYSWDNQSYVYADGANATLLGDYSPTRVSANSLDINAIIHTPKSVTKGYVPLTKQTKPGAFGVKENGQKTRNKPGAIDVDFLNEQNRGPRTGSQPEDTDICHSISQDIVIKREDYNLADFSTNREQAMFFVIKSYSEDDIHKSIKYNVWASTPNGNQRLDNAFQSAKSQKSTCPVFLFFSVNASGQFCGVAEMVDRVNFSKSMDFWQQDKWNGFFPVKWHIIKDVPNSHFRHIILENNDNKPVTNSRDTQEVKFSQGIEMLNIFKDFNAKTSILDDFSFYDNRQKAMQNRRIKVNAPNLEGITAKFTDGTPVDQRAADVAPLIAGFKGIDLGPAKSGGAVKE